MVSVPPKGTKNLRVVDASIAPLQISAHLMQMTYGIAERAADLLKTQVRSTVGPSRGMQPLPTPADFRASSSFSVRRRNRD